MSMLITNAGKEAVARALADGTPITMAEMGLGTEDRHPTGGETALTAEVIRKPILANGVEEQKSYFDARLEAEDGPFLLYEVGLFDDAGTLLFIGRIEGFNKLVLTDQPVTLDVRVYVLTSQLQSVVVQVNTSFAFVPAARHVDTGGGLAGGGELNTDLTLTLEIGNLPAMTGAEVDPAADSFAIRDDNDEGNPAHKRITGTELAKMLVATPEFANGLSTPVSLVGPAGIYPGTDNVYTITDYDDFATWEVSVDAGTVTRSDETITITLPDGEPDGPMTLQVTRNGRVAVFDITILAPSVTQPSMTSPADGATEVAVSAALSTSAFATVPVDADTHQSTDWQVASDSGFTQIAWESLADTANLEAIEVPSGTLDPLTAYYARARHVGATMGPSAYAAPVQFTTADLPYPNAEVAKLLASDGAAGDGFGEQVDLSGSFAVIGSPKDDDTANTSGSAYIFERDGAGIWSEVAKLNASDADQDDFFGSSVAIDGDYVVIGARRDEASGTDSGSAYIFERDVGGAWLEVAKLTPADGAGDEFFGVTSDISGNFAVIGAHQSDEVSGADAGSAYIFERDGAGNWQEVAKLIDSDGGDFFGEGVAIDGNYVVVGSYLKDSTGAAYVFEHDGAGNWPEVAKLTASDAAGSDNFGRAVSISGDHAVITASRDDDNGSDSGSAYIFERDGAGNWQEVAKLTASDGASGERFGSAAALSGSYAIISAPNDQDNGPNSGSVYVFEHDGAGNWPEVAKLTASDGADGDSFGGFGGSVAIDGDYALIGAAGDDDKGSNSGSVYVFK